MMPNPTLIRELAKMIDHSLLHPTLTDEELRAGCAVALQYNVASVCIKPYAVPLAKALLAGSDPSADAVLVGTVIGFPAGHSTIALKVAETVQACRDGAVEIDMVINIGKALGGDWTYVRDEIRAVHDACRASGAILKVIFETDYLPTDDLIIRLCQICTEVGVEFVKTSTGYGFVKGADGRYGYQGATIPHLQLMLDHVGPGVRVKAAGGVRTLDGLLQVKEMGVSRLGASATVAIMDEAYRRFGGAAPNVPATAQPTHDGY